MNGVESFPNLLTYATTTTDCSAVTGDDVICDNEYIDGVIVTGASDANQTTKGLVEISTDAELAAGTNVGGTGAIIAPEVQVLPPHRQQTKFP